MTTQDHGARAHSIFGGSAMQRVIACPGSALLCRDIPEPKSSEYAADGTCVHEWAAEMLAKNGDTCEGYAGCVLPSGAVFTPDNVRQLDVYLQACASRFDAGPYYVEHRFSLADIDPEMFGTVDFAVYDAATKTAEIYDLKWGAGKWVSAIDNAQLKTYACGFLRTLTDVAVHKVKVHIVQPRINGNEPVRSEEYSTLDLLMWQEGVLRPAVKTARAAGAPFAIGDHCFWCRGKLVCPEMKAKRDAQAVIGFEPARLELVKDCLGLAALYEAANAFSAWAEAAKEYVKAQAVSGNAPRGYKLKERQGRRVWADEQAAEQWLSGSGANPFDLVSPAEAERRVGKAEFNKLDAAHALTKRVDPVQYLQKERG